MLCKDLHKIEIYHEIGRFLAINAAFGEYAEITAPNAWGSAAKNLIKVPAVGYMYFDFLFINGRMKHSCGCGVYSPLLDIVQPGGEPPYIIYAAKKAAELPGVNRHLMLRWEDSAKLKFVSALEKERGQEWAQQFIIDNEQLIHFLYSKIMEEYKPDRLRICAEKLYAWIDEFNEHQ